MFLGGVALTLSEKATLGLVRDRPARSATARPFAGAATGDLYMNSIVFTYKLTEKWTYVFEHDLGTNYNVDQRTGVDNQWYEINNYLIYKINDCWSFGGRFEWFQDPQGARVVGRRAAATTTTSPAASTTSRTPTSRSVRNSATTGLTDSPERRHCRSTTARPTPNSPAAST